MAVKKPEVVIYKTRHATLVARLFDHGAEFKYHPQHTGGHCVSVTAYASILADMMKDESFEKETFTFDQLNLIRDLNKDLLV